MALKGIKVIEMAGLAPVPMCGRILRDFGAQVIKIEKDVQGLIQDTLAYGKKTVHLNLKVPAAVQAVKDLCSRSDVLLDPYRPGVLERLTLGPKELHEVNPQLIIARLSGFGQTGPLALKAGHDINYLAQSGVLSVLGRSGQPPQPPVNLLADFGGGSLMCAIGIMAALLERNTSQRGQVVDCSMVEGSAYAYSFLWATRPHAGFMWPRPDSRGANLLDGGAPFYRTYATKDGKFMAVGALEPKFYCGLLSGLGLAEDKHDQWTGWPQLHQIFEAKFLEKTQQEWTEIFDQLDCCVSPVLSFEEAAQHPHSKARASFAQSGMPKPSPVLSHTPAQASPLTQESEDPYEATAQILREELNYSEEQIEEALRVKSKL
ncbi:AMACR [Cordylochernes scorpioides]|uniref:AMACR n=1 Tax=Cordylochernes scorpioides TaxID=51811 RepID=A0ABY6KWE5_9ARAC|nr:AMACR [Cordylochernes scorpioides]